MERHSATLCRDKRIGVIMGGTSTEREISFRTGQAIYRALKKKNYKVFSIEVSPSLPHLLAKKRIELAFIALHGKGGEDGTIQGLLEIMRIPYTGSGVLASALALHKGMTKHILRAHRLPTPDFQVVRAQDLDRPGFSRTITIPLPVVVKPIAEGSTIGTSIINRKKDLREACARAAHFDQQILVEHYIEGKEITAAILNGKPLPLIEIIPEEGFYNYQAKYTPGKTEYLLPARLKKDTAKEIQQLALKTYQVLGCEGPARVDFRVVEQTGMPYILEINTIPGMTETSLLPMAAKHEGISFEELVERIIHSARLKVN